MLPLVAFICDSEITINAEASDFFTCYGLSVLKSFLFSALFSLDLRSFACFFTYFYHCLILSNRTELVFTPV